MSHAGQITGSDDAGSKGTWLVEIDADGTPVLGFTLLTLETLPDVVPVWTIRLRGGDAEAAFTDEEAVRIGLLKIARIHGRTRRARFWQWKNMRGISRQIGPMQAKSNEPHT